MTYAANPGDALREAEAAERSMDANMADKLVLEAFRSKGGEVNIDQVVEFAVVEYTRVVEILWRLRRRGDIVRTFYETRFALSNS